jgi:glycerate 2-kinase
VLAIARAAVAGASAPRALSQALASPEVSPFVSVPLHVVSAGKAAAAMALAITRHPGLRLKVVIAIGTHSDQAVPAPVEWYQCAHPIPDARSLAAAERALEIASSVGTDECLVLLLSGGASALMALPAPGIALSDKQDCIRTMMLAGADIHALNTVRKHLSAIKGGRLAAACRGTTLTLAVSDVVGDDLSVIGSGPGVADATTWADAAVALERFGGPQHSRAVLELIARGVDGQIGETPKAGDAALARAHAQVIASQRHAVDAARETATSLGYEVVAFAEAITGEAREVAPRWFGRIEDLLRQAGRPVCVLSAGETTVHVTGSGRGGRNQEFVLSLVGLIAEHRRDLVIASVGTDGIDGSTDAAGALIDGSTQNRALAMGLSPDAFLTDNNSYDFFGVLGDLIHLGRTDTNVGDLQIVLSA